jgi:hypothetical protein
VYVPGAKVRHLHAASSVEGSPLFNHYVERNRLLMVAKDAPLRLVAVALFRYLTATASYARRDIVRPVLRRRRPRVTTVRRRLRSLGGFLRLTPSTVRERRRVQRGRVVAHDRLLAWTVEPRRYDRH